MWGASDAKRRADEEYRDGQQESFFQGAGLRELHDVQDAAERHFSNLDDSMKSLYGSIENRYIEDQQPEEPDDNFKVV